MSEFVTESLTELFHLVRSLIPDDQKVVYATPEMPVSEAIRLMETHRYSQLPVLQGHAVLGVFSYRSFTVRLMRMRQLREYAGDLPVDEFIEPFAFFQDGDNWEKIVTPLNQDDGVFVGGHNQLTGLITTMDVLNYLRQVAAPFVLLAEIEMTLRRTIRACVTEDELRVCTVNALAKKYPAVEDIPTDLTEMEFNDYAQIIGNRDNWPHFTIIFGEGDWARKSIASKLQRIRDLRNNALHFKRKIESQDVQDLTDFRDWLQLKTRAYEARHLQAERTTGHTTQDESKEATRRKWDESSFFKTLAETVDEAQVEAARHILHWSKDHMPDIWWGQGMVYGVFIPGITRKNVWHQFFGVWTNGYIEIQFQYMQGRPVFSQEAKRRELLDRLNAIPGIHIDSSRINARPSIPLQHFVDVKVRQQFFDVMQWCIDSIRLEVEEKGVAKTHIKYYRFWSQLLEKAKERTKLHASVSPSQDNWISASSGVRGLYYNYVVRMRDSRLELYIDRGNSSDNKRIFDLLYAQREVIEERFGGSLDWRALDDKRASKVQYIVTQSGLSDEAQWPAVQEALVDAMIQFSQALQPEINQLNL